MLIFWLFLSLSIAFGIGGWVALLVMMWPRKHKRQWMYKPVNWPKGN